jgi:hypothetical protein
MMPASDPRAPKYWRNEQSGRLVGPITRYLANEPLSIEDIRLIGMYCHQWIASPAWLQNPHLIGYEKELIEGLSADARRFRNRKNIDDWMMAAVDLGLDPL